MLAYLINRHVDQKKISQLTGRIIAFNCSDFDKTFYCTFDDKLQIVDGISGEPDVTITASMSGLMNYALNQDRSDLNVNGNIEVAEKLQHMFEKLDIDWEDELAKYTGDVVAHHTSNIFKHLIGAELDSMITDYLQEEAKILPTKTEVDEFLQAVDDLRTDVTRIEAKVKLYEINS